MEHSQAAGVRPELKRTRKWGGFYYEKDKEILGSIGSGGPFGSKLCRMRKQCISKCRKQQRFRSIIFRRRQLRIGFRWEKSDQSCNKRHTGTVLLRKWWQRADRCRYRYRKRSVQPPSAVWTENWAGRCTAGCAERSVRHRSQQLWIYRWESRILLLLFTI